MNLLEARDLILRRAPELGILMNLSEILATVVFMQANHYDLEELLILSAALRISCRSFSTFLFGMDGIFLATSLSSSLPQNEYAQLLRPVRVGNSLLYCVNFGMNVAIEEWMG